MVNLSNKNIIMVSQETGFIKDNVEKALRLMDLLETIFSSAWKDMFALKGGTAINVFYGGLSRLSVDIDLDYLGKERDEMIRDKERIANFLRDALFQKGYVLSSASKSYHALSSSVLQYTNNVGNRDNIKIEINYLDRVHIMPLDYRKMDGLMVMSDVPIPLLEGHELYGSKFAALISRCKPRDVYDVHHMLTRNPMPDKDLLRKCLVFYNCIGGDANITEFDDRLLDGLKASDFKRMLRPLLSKQEHFDEKMAILTVKEKLHELLVLTDEEKEFVRAFQNKEYKPEWLFSDEEIVARIAHHPMALWRMR